MGDIDNHSGCFVPDNQVLEPLLLDWLKPSTHLPEPDQEEASEWLSGLNIEISRNFPTFTPYARNNHSRHG
jgi:hypothetical protein